MTKLEDHIIEIEGTKYVPYDVAQVVLYEGIQNELQNTQSMIQDAFSQFNTAIKDLND